MEKIWIGGISEQDFQTNFEPNERGCDRRMDKIAYWET
jgi:hypothetical protein